MTILVVSCSLDPNSRSRKLGKKCLENLINHGAKAKWLDLSEYSTPNFDNHTIYETKIYHEFHEQVEEAEGIVLCSPVYNWELSSEVKKFIEMVGSTTGRQHGALYDKVVTFVCAAGVAHSYMSHGAMANALMLDFKCIINPYNVYVHNRHWQDDQLIEERERRLEKSMQVKQELCTLLRPRTYQSDWEI